MVAAGSTEVEPHWTSRLQKWVVEHWVVLLSLSSVIAVLSGVSYYHGFLGGLGFEALVFSLQPQAYLLAGGIAFGTFALAYAIFILVTLHGISQLPRSWQPGGGRPLFSRLQAYLKRHPFVPFASATFSLALPFFFTWHWLVPVEGTLPFELPGIVKLLVLLLTGLALGFTALVALLGLDSRSYFAFAVAMLFVLAAFFGGQFGEYRARHFMDDPGKHTIARVWWTPESPGPEGYVVVHQDGNLIYLLMQTAKTNGTSVFHTTVVDLGSVHRIVFLPPGADTNRTYPGLPGS